MDGDEHQGVTARRVGISQLCVVMPRGDVEASGSAPRALSGREGSNVWVSPFGGVISASPSSDWPGNCGGLARMTHKCGGTYAPCITANQRPTPNRPHRAMDTTVSGKARGGGSLRQ